MLDFQKLNVYTKAKEFNLHISVLLETKKFPDKFIVDQLKRASLSIVLNIAEWSWRFSKADKRNFYTISKGSVFEVISMLDILKDRKTVSDEEY